MNSELIKEQLYPTHGCSKESIERRCHFLNLCTPDRPYLLHSIHIIYSYPFPHVDTFPCSVFNYVQIHSNFGRNVKHFPARLLIQLRPAQTNHSQCTCHHPGHGGALLNPTPFAGAHSLAAEAEAALPVAINHYICTSQEAVGNSSQERDIGTSVENACGLQALLQCNPLI